MADNTGLRTTGIITGLALLLLLLFQPYGGNHNQPIVNNVHYDGSVDDGDDSTGDGSTEDNSNIVLLTGDDSNDNLGSDSTVDDSSSTDGGGSSSSEGGSDGEVSEIQPAYDGNAWLFIYPSNVSIVHLPVKCVALTTIEEVDYVECVLYTPEGDEHARLTIGTGSSTPSYTPLPGECAGNCREFSAWFYSYDAPNSEGTWTVRAYFYSSNPGLVTERETSLRVYDAGGGASTPPGGFMVVPESFMGVLAIILTSVASIAVYMMRFRLSS